MLVNAAKIYSTLGNPNSLIPLAVKDLSATAGMTAGSFVTGKEEGQDRFIDEIGTEFIWLLGIPMFKGIFNKTVFKFLGLDYNFDARNLKDKDVFEKIKKYAPTEEVKKDIEKIGAKKSLFKNAVTAKFFAATALTVGSYIGLTRAKQKYTENKIRKNLIAEYNAKKAKEEKQNSTPSFKGVGSVVESFAFSPVKNMYILDGFITGERLKDSRSTQEFIGYGIKEASTLCFMYYAGGKIQELLEKQAAKKYNKSIGLDARVIEAGELKKMFEDSTIENSLNEFKKANTSKADMYEFLHKNPENMVVKVAKQSDIISLYKDTNKIDTRKYIDLDEVEGVSKKIEELYKQYKTAMSKGETSEKFFAGVKKLKRNSILMNIGTCVFALGIMTPAMMVFKRFMGKEDKEFQTKKEIREQLIKEGLIKG